MSKYLSFLNINHGLNAFSVCLVGRAHFSLDVIQCGVKFQIFMIFKLMEKILKIGLAV